ncbi:hypothetical protein [Nocardiopsis halotolerans]|uniref:hypothetical protein n=1 Tax=Nocardiopsis halotolerans TaxID=124252 RepID=UPI000349E6F0|nr:hypothetical protein [Nocardiopsis halotolerans]
MEEHSTSPDRPQGRLARWQSLTELPLVLAALVFVAAYAWPAVETDLPRRWQELCQAVVFVV